MNATAPPSLLICRSTRLALKKIYRIGLRGEPCGSQACGGPIISKWYKFTAVGVYLLEQKSSIYLARHSGILLSRSRRRRISLDTPLYAPLKLSLTGLRALLLRHA